MDNFGSSDTQGSDERIVVHEYVQHMDAQFSAYQYCARGQEPRRINTRQQPWYFTGRAFLVYKSPTPASEAGARVPLYHALLQNNFGTQDVVLVAGDAAFGTTPQLSRAKDESGNDLPAIGYVRTEAMPGANTEQFYQHWEPGTSNPAIFVYGTASYRNGFKLSPEFIGGPVYAPRTLDYEFVPNTNPNASLGFLLKDRSDGVMMAGDNIPVDFGDWRIRLFAPEGWCFSTFSFAKVGTDDIRGFDGRFFVDSWDPQMISIIDSNQLTSGSNQEYAFNLTMHNGHDFESLDPKFINRSKSGQL